MTGEIARRERRIKREVSSSGTTLLAETVRATQKAPGKHYVATIGNKSRFYNPCNAIAQAIADSLVPHVESSQGRVVEGEAGATIRTRGVVTGCTEFGVQVQVYGRKIWLKKAWVTDLGDGTLRISIAAYNAKTQLRKLVETRNALLAKCRKAKSVRMAPTTSLAGACAK